MLILRRSYSFVCGFTTVAIFSIMAMAAMVAPPFSSAQSEAAPSSAAQPAPNTEVKLMGHSWKLAAIDGHDLDPLVVHPPEMTMIQDGSRIVGLTGCNRFAGTFSLQQDRVSVNSELSLTRRRCPGIGELETSFLNAIRSMDSWKIDDGMLEIFHDSALLAKFKPS